MRVNPKNKIMTTHPSLIPTHLGMHRPRSGPTQRVAVLLNGNAKKVTERVRRKFERLVPPEDLFFSRTIDEARRYALEIIDGGYRTVMVGGGDGTVAHAMNLLLEAARVRGLSKDGLPSIGILRLGTGNGLAALSGAGRPVEEVLRALAGEPGPSHALRLVEDTASGWVCPFASIGYDAQVLCDYVDFLESQTTAMGQKFARSFAGYVYTIGARTIPTELKAERSHFRIVSTGQSSIIDPESQEEIPLARGATMFEGNARAIALGTSPFYGYALKVLPFARRRNDRFHLRVSMASISYLLTHLPSLWSGKLRTPQFVDFLTDGVTIESSVPLPFQMAGEACGRRDRLDLRLADRAFGLVEGAKKMAA